MRPADGSPRYPVSVKGVITNAGKVVLLKNEREEWELPGGRLEIGERPEQCLAREIAEELGVSVTVRALLDAWVYHVLPGRHVLIVTYGTAPLSHTAFTLSHEHKAFGQFAPDEIEALPMPDGYKLSIRQWILMSRGIA